MKKFSPVASSPSFCDVVFFAVGEYLSADTRNTSTTCQIQSENTTFSQNRTKQKSTNACASVSVTHTHIHTFNGPLSETIWVNRYQKDKTKLDFTGARDSEWKWHLLGHMQVCTLLQSDNHASTPPLSFWLAGCHSTTTTPVEQRLFQDNLGQPVPER